MRLLIGSILYSFQHTGHDNRLEVEDLQTGYTSIHYLNDRLADELKYGLAVRGAKEIAER